MKRHLLCGLALLALSLPLVACGDDDDDDDNVAGAGGTAGSGQSGSAGQGGAGAGGTAAGAGGTAAGAGGTAAGTGGTAGTGGAAGTAGAGGETLYCGKKESELGAISKCDDPNGSQCSKDLCQDSGTATDCRKVVEECEADAGCNIAVACGAACQETGEDATAICAPLAIDKSGPTAVTKALAYQSCAKKVTSCGGDGSLDPTGAGGAAGAAGAGGAGGAAAGAGGAGAGGAAAGSGGGSGFVPQSFAGCTFDKAVSAKTTAISGLAYNPPCLKVKVGDTVTLPGMSGHPLEGMTSEGTQPNPIAANQPSGGFKSDQTVTFTAAGSYGFDCVFHKSSGMTGVVYVEP